MKVEVNRFADNGEATLGILFIDVYLNVLPLKIRNKKVKK